ncbi:MAG: DUF134 domain-containing protein [Bacteroidales bacterium]|jgi:predicted DNA-binding protein (UPF0251 family)|nr:DUF134 domain-containing protein [Bacteroidales bacterium]
MPRPLKCRYLSHEAKIKYFKPAGVGVRDLEIVILQKDEIEALRLKDFEGLSQDECAEKMNVSQPTFHRILLNARKKLSDAIVNGKAIELE